MMPFGQQRYSYFQQQLQNRLLYRRFWVFWALYGILYVLLAALWLVRFERGWQAIVLAGIAYFATWSIVAQIINWRYKKQRPYQRFGFIPVASTWLFSRVHPTRFNSFPSRHTMALAAVSAVFLFVSVPLALIGFACTLLVGTARVVLGYHYPLDILAGLALGSATGVLTYIVLNPLLFTK